MINKNNYIPPEAAGYDNDGLEQLHNELHDADADGINEFELDANEGLSTLEKQGVNNMVKDLNSSLKLHLKKASKTKRRKQVDSGIYIIIIVILMLMIIGYVVVKKMLGSN